MSAPACRAHYLYSAGDCRCGRPRPPATPVPGQLPLVELPAPAPAPGDQLALFA